MTREPDRFEAKARELFHTIPTDPRTLLIDEHRLVWHIAAALRAAESSALKRAAQLFDVKPGGRSRDAKYVNGKWVSPDAEAIRALIPPAAAPAAEQAGEAGGAAAPCNPRSTRSPATATGVEQRHPAPAAETGKAQAIEININDSVWVKVTPAGEQIYRQHWTALRMDPPPLRRDADGWTEFQIWELANVFGAAMYNGCSVPVETTIRVATTAPAQVAEARIAALQESLSGERATTRALSEANGELRTRIAELEAKYASAEAQVSELLAMIEHPRIRPIVDEIAAARAAPPEGEGK